MTLLCACFILAEIGFIILLRLAPDMAAYTRKNAFLLLPWRHMNMLVLSFAAMIVVIICCTPTLIAKLARRTYIYALLAILLIIATGIFGTEINGRKLWLKIGPLNFQTVEFVKILAVLFAVGYFTERRAFMPTEHQTSRFHYIHPHMIGPFLGTALFCILPIIFQGDLGPALLLSFLMMLIYALNNGSMLIVILGIATLAGTGYISYHFQWPSMDPFHYSEVLSRARWAISSGRFLGVGLGEGMSSRIPVVQSDFNFIVICEELGLVGALSVIGLYGVILWRGFHIARSQATVYQMLLTGSLTGLLGIQALIIICGNVGLLPLTGITLPFISYGGSSLLVSFIIIGVLLKLSSEKLTARKVV